MKKKKSEGTNGFGSYHSAQRKYSVKGYIALAGIAIVISIILILTLVCYPKKPIPPKKAEFSAEEQSTNIFESVINKPKIQGGMGIANLTTGKKDKAIDHFNKVIEAEPANPTGYLQRGATLLMNGDIDLGTSDLETAASLNPQYEPLAQRCRMIRDLFKQSNMKVSGDQIKQMMAKMAPHDVQKMTAQMMSPHKEVKAQK